MDGSEHCVMDVMTNKTMVSFNKNESEPVFTYGDLSIYFNWDWNDSTRPHEMYIFLGETLLYKYWFKTKQRFSAGRPGGLLG